MYRIEGCKTGFSLYHRPAVAALCAVFLFFFDGGIHRLLDNGGHDDLFHAYLAVGKMLLRIHHRAHHQATD